MIGHDDGGQAVIVGIEQVGALFHIAVVVPIQGLLKLDGDGGFYFVPDDVSAGFTSGIEPQTSTLRRAELQRTESNTQKKR